MADDLLNRLTRLERLLRAGFTSAKLGITGALTAVTGTFTNLSIPTGAITSGTYTPTLTNTTNIDSSTAEECMYFRVGDVVHVAGRVTVNATAAAATVMGISLPIASNFGANRNCDGGIWENGGASGEIRANTTSDYAEAAWLSIVTTDEAYYFTFTYRII